MDVVALIGRILFVLIFLTSGVGHLSQTAAMAGYATAKRVPAATAATIGSGVVLLVGALLVLLGIWGDLGALLLVVFLVPTALVMHAFWTERDPVAKQQERIAFLKDIGLAGAALLIFVMYARDAVGLTITGPLF
jgi:putative oxidoreductase